ncbi:MAG TPA: response regulator [Nitrospiraceae bacterium]|nr:response regulator [Nitrospiraceae bacterium]
MGVPGGIQDAPTGCAALVAWRLESESVLVVDDDAGIRRLLAEVLGGNGLRVATAATGAAAIACLRRRSVPVLVVDLHLSDMDGLALIPQVLEIDPRTFIVVVTGYGSVETAVKAMKAGASDFLAKPFQPELVLSTVKRLLELHQLRQERSVLKGTVVKSGAVRLRSPRLMDFGQRDPVPAPDGLTEFERGVAEGERRMREREGAVRAREHMLLAEVIRRLEQTIVGLHATIEEEVRALAFAIATKVVRRAVEASPDLVLDQVQAALARVKDSPSVRVLVHPQDVPILEGAREALTAACEGAVSLVVEGDSGVPPGGCEVQTPTRLVDATLESQLIRLGEALKRRG